MNEVVSIRDHEGDVRQAYLLKKPAGPGTFFTYLDGDLKIIRVAYGCPDCITLHTLWEPAGSLPDMGIGLQSFAAQENHSLSVLGQPIELDITLHSEDGLNMIEVKNPDLPTFGLAPGRYEFEAGALLPETIETKNREGDTVRYHLQSFEYGAALPTIDTLEVRTLPLSNIEPEYEMFSGEEDDPFGHGFSALDAWNHLKSESEEFQSVLREGGCWLSTLYGGGKLRWMEDHPVLEQKVDSTDVTMIDAGGAIRTWEVSRRDEALFGSEWSHREVDEDEVDQPSEPLACPDERHEPAPKLDTTQFVALTERLSRVDEPQENFWVHQLRERDHARGTTQFLRIYTEPGESGGLSRTVTMDATTGWLTAMNLRPEDVHRFDEHGFPEAS